MVTKDSKGDMVKGWRFWIKLTVGAWLSALILIPGLACAQMQPDLPEPDASPLLLRFEERLNHVEAKLDALIQLLETMNLKAVSETTNTQEMINSAPTIHTLQDNSERGGIVTKLTERPNNQSLGWKVVLFQTDPDRSNFRGQSLGTAQTDQTSLKIGSFRHYLNHYKQPLGFERTALFKSSKEGWFGFGIKLDFPPSGQSGFLGGFICHLTIQINGEYLLETMVRMPYGLGNRAKTYSGTILLRPGIQPISEYLACMSDGQHGGKSDTVLDAIQITSLLKRPDDRHLEPANIADFIQPGIAP